MGVISFKGKGVTNKYAMSQKLNAYTTYNWVSNDEQYKKKCMLYIRGSIKILLDIKREFKM